MPKIIAAGVGLPLIGTGATVTTSQPLLDLTQTWNNAAVTFTGLKLNVTDTASAAGSLLLDLQVGSATKFNVSKAGVLTLTGATAVTLTPGVGNLLTLNGGLTAASNIGTTGFMSASNGFTVQNRFFILGGASEGVIRLANSLQTITTDITLSGASGTGNSLATFGGGITLASGNLGIALGFASASAGFTVQNRFFIVGGGSDGVIRLANNDQTNSVDLTIGASNLLTLNGGLKTTGATFALQTATTLTDNAAAQVATMTNGPAAGNPTKWIAINDNGVTRYLPCW